MLGITPVADAPKKPSKGKPGPKPDPSRVRSALLTIRCRNEWRDWLDGFALFLGSNTADTVDESVVAHARDKGYKIAAPKR